MHICIPLRRTLSDLLQRGRRYRKKKADGAKGEGQGNRPEGYKQAVKENVLFEKYYQVRKGITNKRLRVYNYVCQHSSITHSGIGMGGGGGGGGGGLQGLEHPLFLAPQIFLPRSS